MLLIDTKIEPPSPVARLMPRPDLLLMMERIADGRVTLISAPAGYGKTTLVTQWLNADRSRPAAWLSVDQLDNNLDRFVRYIFAALTRVEEGFLVQTEEMLSALRLPPPAVLAESMVFDCERLSRRVVLVLDDYTFVQAPEVHEFVISLVSKLPPTLHLVIVGRIDPPLPLNLWRSRHWLHKLRAADLRCTREETKAFFDISKKTSLTDESIRVIHRKTEGWITGLQLVLLSLTGTTDHEGRIRAFSASDRLVTDYLMEQVIASQPPEIKEILALTSVPERFNSELCEELLAGSGRVSAESSRELFARLYQENLFVVPLDSSHSWYRYHHLFRQFLLERFAKLTSQSQEGILKRAGHWFSANGWVEDALTCLLATGEVDAAEDLIGSHLHDVLASDLSRRTLIRWLDPFPPGEERERIPLLVAWSYIRTLHSDYGGVERLLDMVDAVGSSTPGGRQQRWLAKFRFDLEFLRGITSFWGGDVEKACEFTSMVVDRQSEASGFAKMMSILYYGGSLALTGREAEYVSFVQHTGRELGPAYDPQRLPFMTVEAIVHLYRGELAECRAVALRFTTNTGLSIPKYFEVVGYFLLGVTAYEQNQLDEAQRHFLNVESRRFEAPAFFEQGAASGLAQIELVRGDIDAAERHAATARSIAVKAESSFLLRCSEAVDCHLAVATGKQLDDTTPPPAGFDFVYLSIIQPSQCWAWAQVHNPSGAAREAALELVETALHRAETHGVTRRAIQLSALRALTLDTLGRRVEAVTALEAAVRRATALGFVRSFVDLGEGICTLLHALAERHPGDTQVATLLEAFESGPLRDSRTTGTGAGSTQRATRSAEDRSPDTTAHVYGAACDNLTNRELDVLELLQQRLTNKEIAIRLDIAAATVKMHTLGIYRKLGVSGRRQAVAVAIDRGILTG